MGNSLRWTSTAIAVVAGLLIGFAATNFAYRHHIFAVPGSHSFLARLDRDLELSPQQRGQVVDLVNDTRAKMRQLEEDSYRQRYQLIMQTHDKIRALLTPEQQQKFDRDFGHPEEHEHGHHHHGD